ncbi:MAG: hypothetical protein RhofKO_05530 [Rhodothermales bacterium]
MRDFALKLIAESLFYDEEYGAVGNLSLIDTDEAQERYIAAYIPEEGAYVIEEGTEWEDYDDDDDDAIGYALAVDSDEYGTYDTPNAAAVALLKLAEEEGLTPSITLLFDDDDA